MKHREFTAAGIGGIELYAQGWLPETAPRGVIVVAHGLAEHGGRYETLAGELVQHDYAVYAVDHRGHGRSSGPRANIERFSHLVSDFCAFTGKCARQHLDTPVVMLGHSMGGAVAFASALRVQHTLRGLVLSAPALATDQKLPALQEMFVRLLSVVAPNAGALALPAAGSQPRPGRRRAVRSRSAGPSQGDPSTNAGRTARSDAGIPRASSRTPPAHADPARHRGQAGAARGHPAGLPGFRRARPRHRNSTTACTTRSSTSPSAKRDGRPGSLARALSARSQFEKSSGEARSRTLAASNVSSHEPAAPARPAIGRHRGAAGTGVDDGCRSRTAIEHGSS